MKEITRVLTIKITQIFDCSDDTADHIESYRKKLDKVIAKLAMSELECDNSKCNTQLFIREIDNERE